MQYTLQAGLAQPNFLPGFPTFQIEQALVQPSISVERRLPELRLRFAARVILGLGQDLGDGIVETFLCVADIE